MSRGKQSSEFAGQWRRARRLHAMYAQVAEQAGVALLASAELDSPVDRGDSESLQQAWQWFDRMDQHLAAHHLRAFLQTAPDVDEDLLRALLKHHLEKADKSEADRDKLDYLLVQYFALCAPPVVRDESLDLEYVAQALEPVLGRVFTEPPAWLAPLDELLGDITSCRSLRELLDKRVLELGRALKVSSGDLFYDPAAMLAFTRFNYLLRRTFFRLMHDDLDRIFDCLRRLEILRVGFVDARSAELSEQESLAAIRQTCLDWKTPFRAEYSAGQPLRRLAQLRACVEEALEQATAPAEKASAAAAGAARGQSAAGRDAGEDSPAGDEI